MVNSDIYFWWLHVGWRLLGFPQFSACWADVPWQCPIIKDLVVDVSVGQVFKGSTVSAFNPLAAQRCVLCRQGFSSLFCQAVAGATRMSTSSVYQQYWKEWDSWCARQGLPNNAISAPKVANFFVTFVSDGTGLVYHWYLSFCYFCIFGAS